MVLVAGLMSLSLVDNIQSLQLFPLIASVTSRFKILVLLPMPSNSGKYFKSAIKNTKIYEIKPVSISPTSSIPLPTNTTNYYWASMPMNPIYCTAMVYHNYYSAQNSLISSMSFMGYTKSQIHTSAGVIALNSSSPPTIYLPS